MVEFSKLSWKHRSLAGRLYLNVKYEIGSTCHWPTSLLYIFLLWRWASWNTVSHLLLKVDYTVLASGLEVHSMKEDFPSRIRSSCPLRSPCSHPHLPFPLQVRARYTEGKKLAGNSGSLRQEEGSQGCQSWKTGRIQILDGICPDDKESACNAGGPRFDPWVRKVPWRRQWQPAPVLLPGESYGQRSLAGYSPCGRKELDMTEWLILSLSLTVNLHRFTAALLWSICLVNKRICAKCICCLYNALKTLTVSLKGTSLMSYLERNCFYLVYSYSAGTMLWYCFLIASNAPTYPHNTSNSFRALKENVFIFKSSIIWGTEHCSYIVIELVSYFDE